jgi:hypothetical protein
MQPADFSPHLRDRSRTIEPGVNLRAPAPPNAKSPGNAPGLFGSGGVWGGPTGERPTMTAAVDDVLLGQRSSYRTRCPSRKKAQGPGSDPGALRLRVSCRGFFL